MGIFGSIKDKIMRKSDDYGDFRSHVIGDPIAGADVEPPRFGKDPNPQERFALGPPASRSELETQRFSGEAPPDFGREASEFGPPYARTPFEREAVSMDEQPSRNVNYDVVDRLNIIEAQLSAIRSQTETINERLKNIELKLPRRY